MNKAKYEFFFKFWGGAAKAIAHELGITERNHWFDTKEERKAFKEKIYEFQHLGLVTTEREGEETRLRTVVYITAEYKGKEYDFSYDFGYAYPVHRAKFMFYDGNYSCDCNLSAFIQEEHPEFPKLEECGGEIKYVRLDIRQEEDEKVGAVDVD